ncbi:MAG: primosomal protein N' [Chitinophagales bacterium]
MSIEGLEFEISLFAEVILPLSLPKNYTYGIPKELEEHVATGKRVEIQFGKRKIYAGLIKRVHHDAPEDYRIKPILSVLDAEPIVSESQLKFWEWMAQYYLCAEGDIMNAALPAGFKLESETTVVLQPSFQQDFTSLNDREYLVAEALTVQRELSIGEISKILHRKSVYPIIESLLKKNVVSVKEKLIERYKPRIGTFIRLNPEFSSDGKLRELFDQLEKKAKKQLDVLMSYLHFTHQVSHPRGEYEKVHREVEKSDLLEKSKAGNAALNSLIKKNILIAEKREVGRLANTEDKFLEFELTGHQAEALKKIKEEFESKNVVLLHGITSSGKTNLYIRLIEEAIEKEMQVLYLLPEIALTTQIIERLRNKFGKKVGVYHSRFSRQERVEIWNKLLHGEYRIILGARSALFLPFENPGLIIVDEEHDSSYKQNDPAPRYHGRDSAIWLASQHHCKALLGSATPSLESFMNAGKGKFGFAELKERFGEASLPEIVITDIKAAQRRKQMHSHFSGLLLDEIKSALSRKEQVIIFQNRRGYAPYLECDLCHRVAMCPNCDVHLTYHKFQNELKCHYCGHRKNNFTQCPACGSSKLSITGFGTEKIEDELKIFFPDAVIARLDYDAIKKKGGYQKIIHEFEKEKIQILVGTQMVTKGLDFGNVSLVGIMNADQLMSHLDFRSAERGFQLMSQVSGRAGRKSNRGKVILQTSNPASQLLQFVLAHDYGGFYSEEIIHRKNFFYPPFSRLIQLTFKHKDAKKVWDAAKAIAGVFQKSLGKNLLGPAEPAVNRVRNQYLVQLIFKMNPSSKIVAELKNKIQNELYKLNENQLRAVDVTVDVDPY